MHGVIGTICRYQKVREHDASPSLLTRIERIVVMSMLNATGLSPSSKDLFRSYTRRAQWAERIMSYAVAAKARMSAVSRTALA
jgi:hypothetical protein